MTVAVTDRPLIERIAEVLEAGELQLPVYSAVAARVQAMADRNDVSAEAVERILLHDPALASHILRAANSAFYAGLTPVETVRAAIVRLGLGQIVELAVMCTQRAQYRSADPAVQDLLDRLWRHAMASALGAKWLADRTGYRERSGTAFLGGLLHDIGKLVILKAVEDLRARGEWPPGVPQALLLELMGSLHPEHGGRLIENWKLPAVYARIAREHHAENIDDADMPLLLVRVANRVAARLGFSLQPEPDLVPAALPEVAALGVGEVLIAEMEVVLEDGMKKLVG